MNQRIVTAFLALVLATAWPIGRARAADEPKGQPAYGTDADDSGRNVRDRNGDTRTPTDQGGSTSDRTITQDIRRAVVGDDALSVNAKNVKIITIDGVVTLRGPVKSPDEKTKIAGIARTTHGVKRVDDQLEVERKP